MSLCDPVEALARERKLEPSFLRELGVEADGEAVLIPYTDLTGRPIFRRRRNPPGVSPRFSQPAGVKLRPYGLGRIDTPRVSSRIYLTEGESDAWALWAAGLPALGLPGAQSAQCLEAEYLLGLDWIGVCQDSDRSGLEFAMRVRDRLMQLSYLGELVAITMPQGVKDVCDLRLRDPGAFLAALKDLVDYAVVMLPTRRTEEVRREETGGWPPLVPLNRVPDVPAFPVGVLPARLRAFVEEVAAALPCPADYVAVPLLVVASGAVGASRAVAVTRSHVQGACLFGAVVGPPGCGKSPALSMAVEPLREAERVVRAEWRRARKEYEAAEEAHEAEKKGRQGGTPTPAPTPPVLTRYTVGDATTEALVPIMQDNPRGFVMVRDELVGWVASMNQYRDRGKGADQQFWLSVWSGEEVVVDRKKTHGEGPLVAGRPFVSVVGGLTPDKLPALRGDRGKGPAVLDGFIDRILVSYPAELPPAEESFVEVADSTKAILRRVVERLLCLSMTPIREEGECRWEPVVIPLDDAGREVMRQYTKRSAEERRGDDFPPALAGVWSKMRGYVGRLALVLRCLRWADGEVADPDDRIGAEEMTGAVALAEYFQVHARKVHAAMDADPNAATAARVVRWVVRRGLDTFTRRDVYMANRGTFKTPDDVDPVLNLLVQLGYVRPVRMELPTRGRPASPRYEINPLVHAQNAQNTHKSAARR